VETLRLAMALESGGDGVVITPANFDGRFSSRNDGPWCRDRQPGPSGLFAVHLDTLEDTLALPGSDGFPDTG